MNTPIKYKCERCNNIISAYKESTKTRRKCSKCGSYHIVKIQAEVKRKVNNEKYPLVSIIVVNYKGKKYLDDCFNSLFSLDYPKIEVIMVDNSSNDGSVTYVKKKFSQVKIIQNRINNYALANNLGIKQAKGSFIAILNNDTKADKNWLKELIKVMQSDENIGAVGSKVLFENGKINSAGQIQYPNFYWSDRGYGEKDRGQYNTIEEMDSICGVSVLYRKECLDDVGLLDEDFIMYCEDIDMSLRCKHKGWKLVYAPKSIVYHRYHGTGYVFDEKNPDELAKRYVERNRLLLLAKHFPERLPNAISSSTYFYIEKKYDLLYESLPLVITKLIRVHPKALIEKVIPKIFSYLRKIILFEKDVANIESELKVELKKKYEEIKVLKYDQEKIIKELEQKKKIIVEREQHIKEIEKRLELKKNELRLEKEHAKIDKDTMMKQIKDKSKRLSEKEAQVKELEKKLELNKNDLKNQREHSKLQLRNIEEHLKEAHNIISEKDNELKRIYHSKTFKLFVSNIWNIHNALKGISKKKVKDGYYESIFFHTDEFIKHFNKYLKGYKLTRETKENINHILSLEPNQTNFKNLTEKLSELIIFLAKRKDDKKRLRYLFSYYTLIPFVKPRGISIDISDKCNLQCRICNQWKDNNKNRKLSFKDIKRFMDKISEVFPTTIIEFSGQEPLLKKELLLKSLQYGKSKKLGLALSTNGTLIDQQTANKLVSLNIHHISISLDSVKPKVHDYLRNKEGSFKKAVQALQFLVQAKKLSEEIKMIISVTTVITNNNLDELLDVYSFAKKLGVDSINFNAYVPDNSYFFNKDVNYNDEFWVTKGKILKLNKIINKIIDLKKKNIKPVIGNSIEQLKAISQYFDKKQEFNKRVCLAGYNYFHITNFGEVTVCGKGPHLNIKKDSIDKIWNSYDFLKTRIRVRECKIPCINNCFELV